MRMLVFGAGATGGYFGGRLLEAGCDVSFLVRPRRAATLAETGLVIRSACGDATLAHPRCVLAGAMDGPYDLVLLACKAFDLDGAIDALAPAVGPGTAILPVLNGMRHLDLLAERFGAERVLGGQCVISATLDPDGAIRHLNQAHSLTFGEWEGGERQPGEPGRAGPVDALSHRVAAIRDAMAGARFDVVASGTVLLDMWEKWLFLSSLAAATCLMRATVGEVVAAGGAPLVLRLFDEARAIAERAGVAPRPAFVERSRAMLTQAGSPLTASMLRDLEAGAPVEAEHVLGDLLRRGGGEGHLLGIALTHLRAYEARRLAGR